MATVARLKVLMEADSHKLTSALHKVRKGLRGVGSQIGLLVGAGGFGALLKAQIDTADAQGKFAKRIGIGTEALSQLQFAAEQSGVQTNTLNTSLQRLVRRVAEVATTGKGEAKSTLEKMGLDAKKLNEMEVDVMVGTIADKLKAMGTQGERVASAMKLMDTEGVAMLQMFEDGSAGLDKMREAADKAGATLTKEGAEKAAQVKDAFLEMRTQVNAIAKEFALGLGKPIADFLGGVLVVLRHIIAGFKTFAEMLGASAAVWGQIFSGNFSGAGAIVSDFSLADTFRKNLGGAPAPTSHAGRPVPAYDQYGNDPALDRLGTLPEMTARMTGEAFQKALDNMTLVKIAG